MEKNAEALEAFTAFTARASDRLDALKAHMEDHMGKAPEEIDWGHVGTARRVLELLDEISGVLGIQ